jgi:hypothetical protein
VKGKSNKLQGDQLRKAIRKFWKKHGDAVLCYGPVRKGKHAPVGAGSTTYRAYGKVVGSKTTPRTS